MSFRAFSAVFGCVFLTLAAAPVSAAPSQVATPVQTWKTEESKNPGGNFDHCMVKNIYDNDVMLILAENNEGAQRLALNFPMDKMQQGIAYDLTLQVDKGDVFPVEAQAVSSRLLNIIVPGPLLDQLRKGKQLFIRGSEDEVVYKLSGMNGAISALRDCVTAAKNGAGNGAAPVVETRMADIMPDTKPGPIIKAAPTATAATPARQWQKRDPKVAATITQDKAPSVPVAKVESKTLALLPQAWQDVFTRVHLAPESLGGTTLPQKLDYSWKSGGYQIGLIDALPGDSIEKASLPYLAKMKFACGQSFIAESSPVQKDTARNVTWQLVETACSTDKAHDTISALVFTARGGKNQMVVIEGPADKGAQIIKARNAVLAAMGSVN